MADHTLGYPRVSILSLRGKIYYKRSRRDGPQRARLKAPEINYTVPPTNVDHRYEV